MGIGMFMFLVVIHELGHFIAAKKTGVKVLEFGIGIPPKAFRRWTDKQGTEYTINWLPLWWFVRLKGENPQDPWTFLADDSFITATLWKKLVILFAGVVVNFFCAWLFFSIAFMQGIMPINIMPENSSAGETRSYLMPTLSFLKEQGLVSGEEQIEPAVIEWVSQWSLADQAWLQAWEKIVSIAWTIVTSTNLSTVLSTQFGKSFTMDVEDSSQKIRTVSISCPDDECVLGIIIPLWGNLEITPIRFAPRKAFVAGWHEVVEETKLTFNVLGALLSNLFSFDRSKIQTSVNKLSGPVGIIKVWWSIWQSWGVWMYLAFAGMISLALAVFNVLPIPALDGGRALWVLIQHIGGMKPEKYFVIENYFNMVFFVLLMWLWVYIILMDLVRFWWVQVPFLS